VYRFSSKELHVNSGLYYYGYRWYHPNLQRSPNRDLLGEKGFELLRGGKRSVLGDGPNRYLFVKNNPANRIDALGLTSLLYYYQCFDKRIHPTIDSQCKCICAPTSDEDCEKQCKDCAGAAQLNPRKFCECILQVQEDYTAEQAAKACKKCPDINLKPKKKKKEKEPDFP
jgi:RHS repeat-associated protein